jgi:hypothetical protein
MVVDSANGRLIGVGIGLLAMGWVPSALIAAVGASAEDVAADGGVSADDWTPMYFPIVGPFIAMRTLDPKTSGLGLLLADGILQVGGALGVVWGIIDRRYKAVPQAQVQTGSVKVVPMAGPGLHGLSAVGRF